MSQRKNKLENLLNESHESYYWLGFLFADGHFSDKNRLKLSLSVKDRDHLIKFKDFIDYDTNLINDSFWMHGKEYFISSFSIMDTNTVSILKNKYDIKSNKTENPPNLTSLTDDYKFCFMIGFIDGDGSIQYQTGREDCKISVKCHSSWLNNLEYLFGSARINNNGYAYHCTANNEILRDWKRKALGFNLPIMPRKWDKIDTSKISKYKIAEEWQSKAIDLFNDGKSVKEIAVYLDKKYATVYQALVRKNLIRKEV